MSTLKDKTIAATYDQLVKRADTYAQTGMNIEVMNDSGVVQATGLYLESGATTDNVGIGVSNPDELLELYKVGTQLKLSGGAVDFATFAVAADGALTITTVDDTAALGHIALMPDGNVGIGTIAPESDLCIFSADATVIDTADAVNSNTGSNYGLFMHNSSNVINSFAGIAFDVSTEVDNNSTSASIAAVRLQSGTASHHTAALTFNTNDGGSSSDGELHERMRIMSDGKMGLSDVAEQPIVAPYGVLHIKGNEQLVIEDNSGNAGVGKAWLLQTDSAGTFAVKYSSDAGDSVAFATMWNCEDDGKIGIGRSNPQNLDGKGIHISGGGGNHTSDQEFFVVQAESHDTSNRSATKIGTGITDGNQSGHGHANIWMFNDGGAVYTRLSGSNDPGSTSIDEYSFFTAGVAIGLDDRDNLIRHGTSGDASDTLYIGNVAIDMVSDERVKKNIINTEMDATDVLGNLRVVDFNWNHPEPEPEEEGPIDDSGASINATENLKGTFTGLIAQEMIDHVPFSLSLPTKESYNESLKSGNPMEFDLESDSLWFVHYDRLVPVLIKSIQELTARIATLENA
jgi:hypothetical protein